MDYNKKLTLEGLQYYHSKIKTLFTNVNQSISNERSRATAKETEIASNLSSHTSNTSNPHSVTKEQLGLGDVVESEVATDFSEAETPKFQQTIDDVLDGVNELKGDIVNLTSWDLKGDIAYGKLPKNLVSVSKTTLTTIKSIKSINGVATFEGDNVTFKITADVSKDITKLKSAIGIFL